MPGSSLWLLPPPGSPLTTSLATLISHTSQIFKSPHLFIPHLTLTSEISPSVYGPSPQEWLDALELQPATTEEVRVKFEELGSEDVFFRKLYIKCEKSAGLSELGKIARTQVSGYEKDEGKLEGWVARSWTPHVSLLYHDIPQLDNDALGKHAKLVRDAGIVLRTGGEQGEADKAGDGWVGGTLVLVPTDRPIDQWMPIAERIL